MHSSLWDRDWKEKCGSIHTKMLMYEWAWYSEQLVTNLLYTTDNILCYYSQKNVFPISFYHLTPSSDAIFGKPIYKQIISDNLRNRCFVRLVCRELPPTLNCLRWSLMRCREVPRDHHPSTVWSAFPQAVWLILFVCWFPSSLHVCHL